MILTKHSTKLTQLKKLFNDIVSRDFGPHLGACESDRVQKRLYRWTKVFHLSCISLKTMGM